MKWTTILLLVTGLTGAVIAGPLEPPASPAPTAKPLAVVEPRIAINAENTPGDADSLFRIVEDGSYYLTGNVTGVSGKRGIEIRAFEVSIDLMGFAVQGVPGSLDGIAADISSAAVIIRNGVVYDWGMDGIDLFSDGTVFSCLIEDVVSWGNAVGIRAGNNCVIRGCTSRGNWSAGILVGNSSVVRDCAVTANQGIGISAYTSNTITNNVIHLNGQYGILASVGSIVEGNSVVQNGTHGIAIGAGCVVRGNTFHQNGYTGTGAGIFCDGYDNRIEENNCTQNDWGIRVVQSGNMILGNCCSGNTTANYDIGSGNRYGPIIDLTPGSAPAALGNSAGSTVGTGDPWANFAY